MNKKKTRLIDSFKAITESGKMVTIFVHQEFIIAEEFGEEPQEIPGIKRLSSPAGVGVNKLDEEKYEILANTGKIIATRIR